MQAITTIGLDVAKSVFQVHSVNADGNVVLRRQLKRRYVLAFFQKLPSCLVGIEACASLGVVSHRAKIVSPIRCNGAAATTLIESDCAHAKPINQMLPSA